MSEAVEQEYVDEAKRFLRNHDPLYQVRNGRLYCDGIEVFKEQLTPDELKKWFPEDHARTYGAASFACPLCLKPVDGTDKRGLVSHMMRSHPEEYKPLAKAFREADDVPSMVALIRPEPPPDEAEDQEVA